MHRSALILILGMVMLIVAVTLALLLSAGK